MQLLLSSRSQILELLRHPIMTSTDGTSPQISQWEVVIRANLRQPLASWVTGRTLPSTIGKLSKSCWSGTKENNVPGCLYQVCLHEQITMTTDCRHLPSTEKVFPLTLAGHVLWTMSQERKTSISIMLPLQHSTTTAILPAIFFRWTWISRLAYPTGSLPLSFLEKSLWSNKHRYFYRSPLTLSDEQIPRYSAKLPTSVPTWHKCSYSQYVSVTDRLSERSVLFPTSIISTSEPRSVLTSSIHLDVCWNELASLQHKHLHFKKQLQ